MKYQELLRHSCRVAMSCLPPARVVIGGALSLASMTTMAADWAFEPRIALSAEYDDNDRMSAVTANEVEVYGPKIDARMVLRGKTPRTTFTLTPQVVLTSYFEGEEDDLENYYIRMVLANEGQRVDSSLNARYTSVTTLGGYFPGSAGEDPVLGEPDPGENVPRFATDNREDRFAIEPGAAFDITERQVLELAAEYLDVSFDKQRPGDRDFENVSLRANYRLKVSEMSTLALLTTFEQYDPVDDEATDYWSAGGEWGRSWSQTSKVYLRAGASFVDTSQASGGSSDWSTGFSGGVGAEWTYQVTRIFADLNQYLDPNADGQLVERLQLRLSFERDLSQKTTLRLGVRGVKDEAPDDSTTFESQKYVSADAGFRWRMARDWSLFGGYTYRWKDRESAIDEATGNALNLGVAWQPGRL